MTSKEFVTWMQGFVEACHEYAPTPKQWDALKDKLKEVDDSFPLGGILSDPNTFRVHEPYPRWQEPHRINPYYVGDVPGTNNPFLPNGTGGGTGVITTTPGVGSITTINSPLGLSGMTTTTTYGYPSGSLWHYTNGKNDIKD